MDWNPAARELWGAWPDTRDHQCRQSFYCLEKSVWKDGSSFNLMKTVMRHEVLECNMTTFAHLSLSEIMEWTFQFASSGQSWIYKKEHSICLKLNLRTLIEKLLIRSGFLNKASKVIKQRKPEMVTEDRSSNLSSENSAKNNTGDIDSWGAV